jgi:hypothetical protein
MFWKFIFFPAVNSKINKNWKKNFQTLKTTKLIKKNVLNSYQSGAGKWLALPKIIPY